MNIEFSRQILEKFSDIKFHENPSRGKRSCSVRTNGRADVRKTDRQTDMTKLIFAFGNFENTPKNH